VSAALPSKFNRWLVAVLLTVSALVLGAFFLLRAQQGRGASLPVFGQVTGFVLTNQAGQVFDSSRLGGQVWVANLIFTRCPGPCPKLTQHFALLQSQLGAREPVRLVTLTADPEHDTPPVLEEYGRRFGADFRRWDFLTGLRADINRVAMRQLLLAVEEKPPAERETDLDLYLHSTKWVLVDGAGRLRGVYEGTEPAAAEAAARDIRRLLRERGG
jgi:protein SCO1